MQLRSYFFGIYKFNDFVLRGEGGYESFLMKKCVKYFHLNSERKFCKSFLINFYGEKLRKAHNHENIQSERSHENETQYEENFWNDPNSTTLLILFKFNMCFLWWTHISEIVVSVSLNKIQWEISFSNYEIYGVLLYWK